MEDLSIMWLIVRQVDANIDNKNDDPFPKLTRHSTDYISHQHSYLEDVGEISEVEDVVELDGSGEEGGGNLLVELQCRVDQLLRVPLYLGGEAALTEMSIENVLVNCLEGLQSREADGKYAGN